MPEEVFWIVIEAVRNARRHATDATGIKIATMWSTSELHVHIEDDGPGFANIQIGNVSTGLRSMKERAKVIGARVDIDTCRSGRRVALVLPLGRVRKLK